MPFQGWKKEQKSRKRKKLLKFLGYFLLVVVGVFLLLALNRISNILKKSLWNGDGRLTVALNSDPVLIASVDPNGETINLISIPVNVYVESINGHGFYQAGSLWRLGELYQNTSEIFCGSLQNYFGIPVDSWMAKSASDSWPISASDLADKTAAKKLVLGILSQSVRKHIQTDLSLWDLIRFWYKVKITRSGKIEIVDLQHTNVITSENISDNTLVWQVNLVLFDQLISKMFIDKKIREENFSIGVFNGTDYANLANQAARLVVNSGGRVVEVGDWKEKVKRCQLFSQKENFEKYTVQKLLKVFNCEYKNEPGENGHSEIMLVLGNDYGRKIKGQ